MSDIFAKRLRSARMNANKTQQYMAETLGITQVGYGGWERGESEPSFNTLVRLCQIFKVSADWLIGVDANRQDDMMLKINSLKTEADQANQTLQRLLNQLKEMEKNI